MTDGQSELAEQIDADPDLGSASRVRGRCNLLAKMIEEHTPPTIVLNQFRLLTNSVIRAVQLEIKAREVQHHNSEVKDFREEDSVWCPHCLTAIEDCDSPPRTTFCEECSTWNSDCDCEKREQS